MAETTLEFDVVYNPPAGQEAKAFFADRTRKLIVAVEYFAGRVCWQNFFETAKKDTRVFSLSCGLTRWWYNYMHMH